MEALADFGTVDLLGVQALTSAIYRVWNGAFDKAAALQLATVLVGLALTLLAVERVLRGRARYHQALGRGDAIAPVRLRGWRGWLAAFPCAALLVVVFVLPVAQLVAWSVETIADGTVDPRIGNAIFSTLMLGVDRGHGGRGHRGGRRLRACGSSRPASAARRPGSPPSATAVPGTVVAVAVYVPLVWVDRRLVDGADAVFGTDIGLVFTGSILGLVIAYLVRFHALSYTSIESRMGRIQPEPRRCRRARSAPIGPGCSPTCTCRCCGPGSPPRRCWCWSRS